MKTPKYKFLEHTADVKFQAFGKTLDEAFTHAGLAVAEIITRGQIIKSKRKEKIAVVGNDLESLLYNFIEELIYLVDAKAFVLSKIKVKVDEKDISLKAELEGDGTANYDLDVVKAPTYAEMHIKKTNKGYEIQAVVDV